MSVARSIPAVQTKAVRLWQEDRITALPMSQSFEVEGDTGTYVVTIIGDNHDAQAVACTCRASGHCSHKMAALLKFADVDELDPFEGLV